MIYLISAGHWSDYQVQCVVKGPATISLALAQRMRDRYAAIKQKCSDFWDDPAADMDAIPEVDALWKTALIAEFGFKEVETSEIHEDNFPAPPQNPGGEKA